MALTAKQEAFAAHYALNRNGCAAYRHAYDVKAETLDTTVAPEASRLLADPNVSARVNDLIVAATATSEPVLNLAKLFDIIASGILADPNELTGLRVGSCRHCWSVGHAYHWKDYEFVEAVSLAEQHREPIPDCSGGLGYWETKPPNPECPRCEGRGRSYPAWKDTTQLSPGARVLFQGVKQTRNGLEVLTLDKGKLIDMAVRMQGGFKDNVNLGGAVGALLAHVDLSTKTPTEAARAYADMIGKK